MANLGNFDASAVPPNAPLELIPAGDYPVQIVASEMRPTKDGNGQYLWLELDILDGQYKGRKLWDRLNLANANQQAVEIAERTLSAICHATGVLQVSDSEQLHFRPMLARVSKRPAQGNYDAQNEVKGYKPLAQAQAPAPAQAPAQRTAPAASAPPWRRSA